MNTQAPSSPSGTGPGPDAAPGEQFFGRIRSYGVVRPDEGRWAAGVCAGLARRWGLDPLLVRGLFVVVSIVSGLGLGLYGLLWMFLPHPDGRIHAQQVLRGVVTAGFIGSAIFTLGLPFGNAAWNDHGSFHPFGNLVFLVLVGLGVWWLLTKHGSRHQRGPGTPGGHGFGGPGFGGHGFGGPGFGGPGFGGPGQPSAPGTPSAPDAPPSAPTGSSGPDAPTYGTPAPGATGHPGGPETESSMYGQTYAPPVAGYAPPTMVAPPRPVDTARPLRALTRTTLGASLVAAGGVLAWDRWIGNISDPGFVASAVALGVIALGIVLAGLIGRRAGLLVPLAVVLAISAANGATWQGTSANVDREQSWTPATAAAASTGYELGAGRAVLDLTAPGLITGATSATPVKIPASVGAGELVVIVPKGAGSRVEASIGLGAVTNRVNRAEDFGGTGVNQTITNGTNPVLIVTAKVGLGHIEVVQQGTEVIR